jgi:hypothetical protein
MRDDFASGLSRYGRNLPPPRVGGGSLSFNQPVDFQKMTAYIQPHG